MSCLWICLSLLFVAPSLQKSALFGVSLECNPTVEVVAGEDVTLNCTLSMEDECIGESYVWNNTHGKITCNNRDLMEYTCDWDSQTYVSLTIRNVKKDENYTISIVADCDLLSSHIKLQVKPNSNDTNGKIVSTPDAESTTDLHKTAVILTIFIALGILCVLFLTGRGRIITGYFKKIIQGEPIDQGRNTPLIA